MIAIHQEPLQRFVLSNISWETYEALLRELGESHCRVTYDNGDLELMTLSVGHENWGEWIGRLIFVVALEWKKPLFSGGSTTLKKRLRKKGLEPDKCFWLKDEKHMRGKAEWNVLLDPPPDLSVEIDVTRSSLDRLGIYAALGVPEIWRFDGSTFQVLILGPSGKYKERSKSLAFPTLPLGDFAGFVEKLGTADETTLIAEFVDWLRADVAPTKEDAVGRKNGRKQA